MPDPAPTYTFGVNDLLALADNVNFKCISCGKTDGYKTSVSKDGAGEYVAAAEKSYDEQMEVKAEYEAMILGVLTFPAIVMGAAANGYVVTQVQLATGMQHLKMSVTAHKHPAGTHNANEFTLVFPDDVPGWGAYDFLGAGNDGVQSSTWSASVDHVDKLKGDGTWLCGRSQGCKIEASSEYISDTIPAPDGDLGWTLDSNEVKTGGDFYTASLKAHQYQAPDAE